MTDVETYVKAFNDLDVDKLMTEFPNYYIFEDTLVFRKDQDDAETHHFESRQHAEEFIAARCGKFEILESDMTSPRLFVCSYGENSACDSFIEWYEDSKIAYVNFRHHGHETSVGQSRLNEYHVALIKVFTKFFWRDNKSTEWNLNNICFCFKVMYGLKNPLAYLSRYDFALLGDYGYECAVKTGNVSDKHAWHDELNESVMALKTVPCFSTATSSDKCRVNTTPWMCRGFTYAEWSDVNDNIWSDRDPLVVKPGKVISGRAFLMAKHFLEFSNTLLRILHISKTVFSEDKETEMTSFAYIDLCGLWPALDWKRKGKMKMCSKGIVWFCDREAEQIYGKVEMPPIIELIFRTETISEHVLPDPNHGELRSNFREYLVQMRAYLKALHYNKPGTQMLLLNGEDKIAYMEHLGDFGYCGDTRVDKFKRRECVRWDEKKMRYILEKVKETPANIWSTVRVPSNGSVSSRLYRLTGIPIGRNLRLLERRAKNEDISKNTPQASGGDSKKPTATLQFALEPETDDDEYKSADDGTGRSTAVAEDNNQKQAKKTKCKKTKNKK